MTVMTIDYRATRARQRWDRTPVAAIRVVKSAPATPFEMVMAGLALLTPEERDLVAHEMRRLSPPMMAPSSEGPFVPRATLALVASIKDHDGTMGDNDLFATQETDMGPYLEDEYEGPGIGHIADQELDAIEQSAWAAYADDHTIPERPSLWHDNPIARWWQRRRDYADYVAGRKPNQYEVDRPQYIHVGNDPDCGPNGVRIWRDTGAYPVSFTSHQEAPGRVLRYYDPLHRMASYLETWIWPVLGVAMFCIGYYQTLATMAIWTTVAAVMFMGAKLLRYLADNDIDLTKWREYITIPAMVAAREGARR